MSTATNMSTATKVDSLTPFARRRLVRQLKDALLAVSTLQKLSCAYADTLTDPVRADDVRSQARRTFGDIADTLDYGLKLHERLLTDNPPPPRKAPAPKLRREQQVLKAFLDSSAPKPHGVRTCPHCGLAQLDDIGDCVQCSDEDCDWTIDRAAYEAVAGPIGGWA